MKRLTMAFLVTCWCVLSLGACTIEERPTPKPDSIATAFAIDAPADLATVKPKWVSVYFNQNASTAESKAFRNENFAVNMVFTDGLKSPRHEYFYLTRAGDQTPSSKWLLDMYGLTVTMIPGTQYVDLSVPANRDILASAALRHTLELGVQGALFDCPLDVAPGQEMYAVDLVETVEEVFADAYLEDWWNIGDGWTWSLTDTNAVYPIPRAWAFINRRTKYQFCQVAVDLVDSRNRLKQLSLTMATATKRHAEGKQVMIGLWDNGGMNADLAQQMARGYALSADPGVYWHYNSAWSPTSPAQQLPKRIPTTITEPNQMLGARAFDVYRSSDATQAIVFLHGGGGTKAHSAYQLGVKAQDNSTVYTIANPQVLLDNRALLVFPQGLALPASPGARTWDNYVMMSGADDVGFLKDLVPYIKARYGVSRVFLAGHSNGGMMANRIWCEVPDLFDGYIAISGPPAERYLTAPCAPTKPILSIVGSNDTVLQNQDWNAATWRIANKLVAVSRPAWADPDVCGEQAFMARRKALCGDCATLVRVEGSDHMVEDLEAAAGRTLLSMMFEFTGRTP